MTDWRVIGDRDATNVAFIPLPPGPRAQAILDRLINGPTPEEVVRTAAVVAQRDAEQREKLAALRTRHDALVAQHTSHRILTALLDQHRPHEYGEDRYASCHGCPSSWDEYGEEYHQSWPCPPWSLISGLSPG